MVEDVKRFLARGTSDNKCYALTVVFHGGGTVDFASSAIVQGGGRGCGYLGSSGAVWSIETAEAAPGWTFGGSGRWECPGERLEAGGWRLEAGGGVRVRSLDDGEVGDLDGETGE